MAEINKRRSDRVLVTMPVTVSGTDPAGKPFSEDATTVTVSQYGAAIAVKTPLVPGQEITIRRYRRPAARVAECHVAGQTGQQADMQVFSVAFLKPAEGFWDVYFPPLPSARETAGRAVLECKGCGMRMVVHLDRGELTIYNANRLLSLNCTTCRKSTIWVESPRETTKQPELGPPNAARLAVAPSTPLANNQRKHRRVETEIPVCIRQAGSDDDVATTVDISHGGLRFTTSRQYLAGSFVQVAVPYSTTGLNVFVDARVVHGAKMPSQELYWFGIRYLAENESSS